MFINDNNESDVDDSDLDERSITENLTVENNMEGNIVPQRELVSFENEMEDDGLYYLLGWIARKLHSKHSNLGYPSSTICHTEHPYNIPDWIQHLSHGGLFIPSEYFKGIGDKMEAVFKYNSDIFYEKKVSEAYLTEFRKEDSLKNVGLDILKVFIRQRLLIRIKYLNIQRSKK